jgi:hypothetical protein
MFYYKSIPQKATLNNSNLTSNTKFNFHFYNLFMKIQFCVDYCYEKTMDEKKKPKCLNT